MERQLLAGLSDAQRGVLCEFFAGRISAGQLTQRLGIETPSPTQASSPRPDPAVPEAESGLTGRRTARTAGVARRQRIVERVLEGVLSLAQRRGQIGSDLRPPSA